MMLHYIPKKYEDYWYVVYKIPKYENVYQPVCDCNTENQAIEECNRLNSLMSEKEIVSFENRKIIKGFYSDNE